MSELKPCPFCGGTKICTEKGINLNYCDNCSAESNVEHWNTRPIEDALNRRIAELEAQQRWISVSERLPENKFEQVLVCTTYGVSVRLALEIGEAVTHWMPLPQPPEVNNG
mgnify:CR=1 FL=1